MSSVAEERLSPEEYLRRERAAETKSEYDDGFVYAVSGASPRHNLMGAGLIAALVNRLPRRCRVYTSDMRVRISKPTRFYYPDVSVVCGEPQYAEDQRDVLVNPLIVFEVLSESTAALDRGRKFLSYQAIESLQEYVLLSQDEILVEHFRRDEGQWLYTVARGVDGTLPLPAAGCELSLREIYYQTDLT
jgi:Uma2 family endonuclease